MPRSAYFITHANVVISREVPVPRGPLSELGRSRMRQGLAQPWVRELTAIYCSTEQKAIDGARILAEHLSLDFVPVAELGENDRSATVFCRLTSSSSSPTRFSPSRMPRCGAGNARSMPSRGSYGQSSRL
jgi:hypothetical protein